MNKKTTMIAVVLCALADLTLAIGDGAWARDLPRSDPDRLAILDAVRGKGDVKFIVKDLLKDGDFAYLCALQQAPDGRIFRTDESLEVAKWVLLRDEGTWIPVDAGGGFAASASHVSCVVEHTGVRGSPKRIENQRDIAGVLVDVVRYGVQAALDFGKVDDAPMALLGMLIKRHVVADLSIEHDKDKYDPVQLNMTRQSCPSEKCVEDNRKAFETLNQWRNDAKISSLVWNNCKFGLRVSNLVAIRRCVTEMSPLPHCRPNLNIVADRKDIDRCVAESRALCRRTYGAGTCF